MSEKAPPESNEALIRSRASLHHRTEEEGEANLGLRSAPGIAPSEVIGPPSDAASDQGQEIVIPGYNPTLDEPRPQDMGEYLR